MNVWSAAACGLLLTTAACDSDPDATGPMGSGSTIELRGDTDLFLWLTADRDAVVRCSDIGCPDGDNNYGLDGFLSASNEPRDVKASYVHFYLPEVPQGAEVVEAYIELYHAGTREDGQPDDQCLPMAPAAAPWGWDTITWNNQPNTIYAGAGGAFMIGVRSAAWSGTGDIAGHVRGLFDGSLPNDGYALFAESGTPPYHDKGFDSTNGVSRAVHGVGTSPRMLVRLRLGEGSDDRTIVFPPLSADNDLPFDGEDVVMAHAQTAEDWPEQWAVTALQNTAGCAS